MTGTKGKSRLAAAALHGAAWGCCVAVFLTGCRLMPFAAKRDVSEKLELNRQGIAAFERQEYDTAEKKFIEAAERDKADLTSRRYYAETLWARGAKSDAVQLLAELSKTEGPLDDSLAINQSLAEKLLEEKQPVSALNYAERVVQSSPQSSRGWALRAEVYRQLGKNEEAIGDYHHALHFDPDNREFLRSLAELESQAGRCESSLATWQRLGRTYPGNSQPEEVLCGKAEACRRLKRYDESIRCYEQVLAQHPDRSSLYRLLAEIHLERNDMSSAQEVTRRAEGAFPNDPAIHELASRIEQLRIARSGESSPY